MLIFPDDDERRRKRTPETAEFKIWRRSEWPSRRKGGRTRPHRPSLFLSFFPAFLGVQNSGTFNVPELNFLPSLLFFFFLARNVFFFINPKIEKSQTKDIKIIFLVSERRREKESVKERALDDGTGEYSSRVSLSVSLSLRKTEENPSDDDAKRDDVKPPPFAEKKRDDRHVSVVARAHVRGKSAKKSTTRGGVV